MILVQGMYTNAGNGVRVGKGYNQEWGPSELSTPSECWMPCHVSSILVFQVDEIVIIADSMKENVNRLLIWKEAFEEKGLRVDAGKPKVMICGTGLGILQSSGEFPNCAACRTGVTSTANTGYIRNVDGCND